MKVVFYHNTVLLFQKQLLIPYNFKTRDKKLKIVNTRAGPKKHFYNSDCSNLQTQFYPLKMIILA